MVVVILNGMFIEYVFFCIEDGIVQINKFYQYCFSGNQKSKKYFVGEINLIFIGSNHIMN